MAWFLVLMLLGREVLLQVNEPEFCLDLALRYFLVKKDSMWSCPAMLWFTSGTWEPRTGYFKRDPRKMPVLAFSCSSF